MSRLRSLLLVLGAFGGALGVGALIFKPVQEPASAGASREPERSVKPLAAAPAPTPVALAQTAQPAPQEASPAAISNPVVRNLKQVEDGVQNQNVRMSTHLAENYAQGIRHDRPWMRSMPMRWTPRGRELREGFKPVDRLAEPAGVKGQVEQFGQSERYLYRGTYPGVDERLQIRWDGGVEHDYILNHKPDDLGRATFLAFCGRLQLDAGMSIWDGDQKIQGRHVTNDALLIRDYCGNVIYHLRRPCAYDAKLTRPDGSFDDAIQDQAPGSLSGCQYQVEVLPDGSIDLAVATPTAWLDDPARAWPVTVDPNTGPNGLADGFYTGTVGTGSIQAIHGSGVPAQPFFNCGQTSGYVNYPMPFAFNYYGVAVAAIQVHEDGYIHMGPPPAFPNCTLVGSGLEFNNTQLPNTNLPNNTIYSYWDNLRFSGNYNLLGQQDAAGTIPSAIYITTQGPIGNRRVIIEWYKMGFDGGSGSERITFETILYECENRIEIIIGISDPVLPEVDRGESTVGIEDPTGTIGIQYDFDSKTHGPFNPTSGQIEPLAPITIGTSVSFTPISGVTGTIEVDLNNDGDFVDAGESPINDGDVVDPGRCLPIQTCFRVKVTPPVLTCGSANTPTTPPSFQYFWTFSLCDPLLGGNTMIAQAFTQGFCKTFTVPGYVHVSLTITSSAGGATTTNFVFLVCDFPRVYLTANPQGGVAPLEVNFLTNSVYPLPPNPTAPTPGSQITFTAAQSPVWTIDKVLLGPPSPDLSGFVPATAGTDYDVLPGGGSADGITPINATVNFLLPAIYRVTTTYHYTAILTDPCTGDTESPPGDYTFAYSIYIFVQSDQTIDDNMVITKSQFTVSWPGKIDGPDPDILPDAPRRDTMLISGQFSFTDDTFTPSYLADPTHNIRVNVILNGYADEADKVFSVGDGDLGPDGYLKVFQKGVRDRSFKLDYQTGKFSCSSKLLQLDQILGLTNLTEFKLLPVSIRIEIWDASVPLTGLLIYPPAGTPPDSAIITYNYHSRQNGKAVGVYTMGDFTLDGMEMNFTIDVNGTAVPGGIQKISIPGSGGQEVMVSGVFVVTKATFKVIGPNVVADISGKLSRFGGDDLRPRDDSVVIVTIGGYTESLSLIADPTWTITGKNKQEFIQFVRSKVLDQDPVDDAIKTLSWFNKAGDFHITTYPMAMALAGPVQVMTLGLQITPENSPNIFDGQTTFLLFQKNAAATLFVH